MPETSNTRNPRTPESSERGFYYLWFFIGHIVHHHDYQITIAAFQIKITLNYKENQSGET